MVGTAFCCDNPGCPDGAHCEYRRGDAGTCGEQGCPDPADPRVRYVSQDPEHCQAVNFRCEPGEQMFSDACGCGCLIMGRDEHCDDGTEPLCEMIPPVCNEFEILAYQNNCYRCVNPATCHPWGRDPGCARDADCPAEQYCYECGTSSCPMCEDCVAACTLHWCPTEQQAACDMARPDCPAGQVSVIRQGCWVCTDRAACEPVVSKPRG